MRNREEAVRRAKELTAQMTLEEKVSQLRYDAPAIKRLGVSAYNWWNEALHGVARAGTATIFPQAIGLAAMFDDELLEKVSAAIAEEGRAKYNAYSKQGDKDIYKGLTFWSPNVNIFRDPRWGRGHETYGEDPFLSSRLGVAFIKGLQGDNEIMKTAACVKHFAAHSGPEAIRHEFNAIVSKKDLEETYLPAFEACVKEGEVEAVMGAYNRMNSEPCCGSEYLIKKVLREDWGFKGHFVSDCWAIKDFHENHRVTNSAKESAAMALKAGCDVNCGNTYLHILNAYYDGLVTEKDITLSVERLFTTRYLLGLFDETAFDQIPYEVVECKDHLNLALVTSRKSIVMLKNNGILPLNKERIRTIGVIGPNANNRRALIGNYYGTASSYTTVLEGIQENVGDDIRVLYSEGCNLIKDRVEGLALYQDRLSEAVTVANHSDIVVLVLGLDESLEGEEKDVGNNVGSGDKTGIELPKVQVELLEKVTEVGKPIIVVLMAGSSIDLSYADKYADAILLAWYPGACGGKAVADVLFGNCSPSAKLPITFYSTIENMPDFEDYSMKNRTYRYIKETALYPFGYGLTYADIELISTNLINQPTKTSDILVEVKLINRGPYRTDEVIQFYIKDMESKYAVHNYSLCGFKRINIKSQEEKSIQIRIPNRAMTAVDDEGKRYIDSNRFKIYAGLSQPDLRSIELVGKTPIEIDINI